MGDEINREKRAAAEAAAHMVREGMVVGLGTGSTAEFVIRSLGERVASGLRIVGVPTSHRTEALAQTCGIALTDLQSIDRVDLTIDGADEIDRRTVVVLKGRGGALVREKLVASASEYVVIIADSSKMVDRIGSSHPIPVEVLPFGWRVPAVKLADLGGVVTLRAMTGGQTPFTSDNGNYILDVQFGPIEDPQRLAVAIKAITGVVDHGLFIDVVDRVLVGTSLGVTSISPTGR